MECVYVSLLLNICLDLYVTLSVALSRPKSQRKKTHPNLWILTQLHDYFLRSEFLGVEMLPKFSLSPFSFFPCGGRMNSLSPLFSNSKNTSLWQNKKEMVPPFSSSLTFTLGESILLRHHIRAYENSALSFFKVAAEWLLLGSLLPNKF